MRSGFFHYSLFFFLALLPDAGASIRNVDVSFYSENIALYYDSGFLFEAPISPEKYSTFSNKSQIQEFYEKLERSNYTTLLDNIYRERQRLKLNDWLTYELMKKSVDVIFYRFSKNHRTLVCWFLLNKAGFDARITYLKKQLYLNVYSEDELFEIPIIREGGRPLANLTSIHENGRALNMLYVSSFVPNKKGKSFSFDLSALPALRPIIASQVVHFETRESHFEMTVEFDETVVNLMRNYPFISENKYLEVPLSETLRNSLLPLVRKLTNGKTWKETLEIIASLTRTGFAYKPDEVVYGKSKPMVADEIFHYHFSDCEDRSALFYGIVREILDFPMIALAYPDHITIAVATPDPIGSTAVVHKGRDYFICDPTGPVGSFSVGEMPKEYRNRKFKIISSYK